MSSGGLVRRLQQRVTQAIGKSQLRRDTPGILDVGFKFVGQEMANGGRSHGLRIALLVYVVVREGGIEQSGEGHDGPVVTGLEVGLIDCRKTRENGRAGSRLSPRAGDFADGSQPKIVDSGVGKGILIRAAVVGDDAKVAAESESMFASSPTPNRLQGYAPARSPGWCWFERRADQGRCRIGRRVEQFARSLPIPWRMKP